MPIKEKLLDLLQDTRQEETAFIDALPAAERAEVGTPEHWSAKDLIGHIATWNMRLLKGLDLRARGETPPDYGDTDHANAGIWDEIHDRSWDDLRALLEEGHRRARQQISALTDDELTNPQPPIQPEAGMLWRRFAGTFTTHTLLHLAQYEAAHGRQAQAGEMQETMAGWLRALDEDPRWQGVITYNLACYYATAGQRERALALLAEGLRLRPDLTTYSRQDVDFASLHADPDFIALTAEEPA